MKESPVLKKHVHVIHSSCNYTLVQRKLVNALLFNAYNNLSNECAYSIKTKDLCELIGYGSRDIAKLKKSLKGLLSTVVEWNVIDSDNKDNDKWSATTLIASAVIQKGVCRYSYSELMRELLYQPEIYGIIDINLMKKFKSNYGLALYENCIRFQNIRQTSWLSLEVFRKLMGVAENKYKVFKDFKKRVIDVAVKEVNELSPIRITPEINKQRNEIRFVLSKEKEHENKLLEHTQDTNILHELIEVFGVSRSTSTEVLEKYGEVYIRQKMDLIVSSPSFKAGAIKHLAGYLLDALEKDYQAPICSQIVVRKIEQENARLIREEKDKDDALQIRYKKYVDNIYMKIEASVSPSEYEKLKAAYLKEIRNNTVLNGMYKKQGFEHPMISNGFREHLKSIMPEKFENMMTIQEFGEVIG